MKKIQYILGVVALAVSVSSCVWDLNVTPIDPNANTVDKVLTDKASLDRYISGVYLGFATSPEKRAARPPKTRGRFIPVGNWRKKILYLSCTKTQISNQLL